MDFVLDFGNAWIKWFDPINNHFGSFRHAILPITENDWDRAMGRDEKVEKGFIRVQGIPYAVGDSANNHLIGERPRGAARYTETYYGVGLAYALAECFGHGAKRRTINLYASHAPQDHNYIRELKLAAQNNWIVESHYGNLMLTVQNVFTFDEPIGGYAHCIYTEKGQEKKRHPLLNTKALIIDVGGYTVDIAAIDRQGNIDHLKLESTRTGVINLTNSFEKALRHRYKSQMRDTQDIDIDNLESAILTGQYRRGRMMLDCAVEANEALNRLTNDVVNIINNAGGVDNFPYMLITGGGGALIANHLQQAIPLAEFIMAEPEMKLMKYANVFGGAKIAALIKGSMNAKSKKPS